MTGGSQKRALFLVFDGGTGVGHLRRLACIAKKLQGRFSCLIVTGHRAAAHWFVPEECEYIHLPSWDSLLKSQAGYWGRKPFLFVDKTEAIQLRQGIFRGVIDAFRPDVIFVDHLPLGAYGELEEIMKSTRCLKYLVTRGVLNETENLQQLVFGGNAQDCLRSCYHRILVACDRNVFDFSRHYKLSSEILQKTVHTGYVIERISQDILKRTREERGINGGNTWVVASAGGGQLGEPLIESCLEIARTHMNIAFDIVLGPRSSLPWGDRYRTVIARDNLYLHKEAYQMPYLNASADLVICSGGYNTLLETLQGNAKILCFPYRTDRRDEQYQHAAQLKKFVDIEVSTELSELPAFFELAMGLIGCQQVRDRRGELDFNGAPFIEKIVLDDLGLSESAVDLTGLCTATEESA